jgi:DNA polymerase-3 subunit epsilon
LFWDLLFEGDGAQSHSPFEGLPAQLTDGSFYRRHEALIEERLSMLLTPGAAMHCLLKTSARHFGALNGVFRWRRDGLSAIRALLNGAKPSSIAVTLRCLCEDYPNQKSGYPDLMVMEGGVAKFVEIKAPGDQLRRHQLRRIVEMREAGIPTEIVRVEWVANPEQVYVVVDVETTGGRASDHRVTEIGAVKVQNGKIVDRYSTLINPMRSIPRNITRLTGITNAMVADAPHFSAVAESFDTFMKDAIFVAHNVNFDFGFLKAEFERVGRPFRYPKLCTCASMRQHYKGHASYSLKSLCNAYDISLESHHRALCDAEAAAELLRLILKKQ